MYDVAREEESMIAKKDLIDKATADGAIDRMNLRVFSVIFMIILLKNT